MKHKIVYIAVTSMLLVACGGGSDSSNSQAKTFKVTTNVSGEGSVTPTQQNVEQGKTTILNLSPKDGYKIQSATGCNGTLKDSVYTTGAINTDCQVQVNFAPLVDLNVPSELEVNSTVKANLKNLTSEWNNKATEINDTQLSFSGNPKLVIDDIFVVKETAYKVVSITGDTTGNTIVTVTQPMLNEIYEKIEISGKMDALEFVPNPELIEDVPQARAITAQKGNIIANSNENGFFTVQYGMSKNFNSYSLSSSGNLKIGAKADFNKWEVISNKGQGTVDVYLNPSILLSLKKSTATGQNYNEGVCSSNASTRKGGRIYLGYIPMGKAVAAIPGGQVLSALINVNIPVCLPVNVSANMQADFLNFSGKYQTKITLGNQDVPKISNQNDLKVEMPPNSATLSEATWSGTAKKIYSAEIKAEAGLEIGFEVADTLGKLANVGVNVAALAKPELKGTFGVALVKSKFSDVMSEPDVCLELKTKAEVVNKAFLKAFWDNEPLTAVATMPFPFVEATTKKWGLCKATSIYKLSYSQTSCNIDVNPSEPFKDRYKARGCSFGNDGQSADIYIDFEKKQKIKAVQIANNFGDEVRLNYDERAFEILDNGFKLRGERIIEVGPYDNPSNDSRELFVDFKTTEKDSQGMPLKGTWEFKFHYYYQNNNNFNEARNGVARGVWALSPTELEKLPSFTPEIVGSCTNLPIGKKLRAKKTMLHMGGEDYYFSNNLDFNSPEAKCNW